MKKIVICGNYGATNIGDEAILAGILALINDSYPSGSANKPEITVLSANPENTTALHNVKSLPLLPAGPRSFFRGLFSGGITRTLDAIRTCDGFILGGGGLFNAEKPLSLIIWGLQAKFALLFKKPLFCIGQSVGPITNFFARYMVKSVFSRARVISLRDRKSQALLHKLGCPLANVIADPAFALHTDLPAGTEREKFIVMSVRPWHKDFSPDLYQYFAQAIDDIHEKYGFKTILTPFSSYPEDDSSVLSNILAQVKNPSAVELFEYSADYHKLLELISRSKAVIGMRLHSLIFATLTRTPFIGISYSDKVASFVSEAGMDEYLINLPEISADVLDIIFSQLMENYDHVTTNLTEKNALLRADARKQEELLRLFIDSLPG
jgi:polysaccharide pyruvyl transferase CsaB